jgi:hypothetical protein
MPTIDLPADELAAVTAVIRAFIEGDKFPHAPRLDPLRPRRLARLEAASGRPSLGKVPKDLIDPAPTPDPKAPPPAKADKRSRSAKAPTPKISPGFKLGRLPPDR